jgi:hypothetical protein
MRIITNNEVYHNADAAGKAELITAGIGAAATIGAALASRQKQSTDVEQRCGKKPLLFGKAQWQDCANKQPGTKAQPTASKPQKKSKTLLYVGIVGGVLLVGGLIYYAVHKNKK